MYATYICMCVYASVYVSEFCISTGSVALQLLEREPAIVASCYVQRAHMPWYSGRATTNDGHVQQH